MNFEGYPEFGFDIEKIKNHTLRERGMKYRVAFVNGLMKSSPLLAENFNRKKRSQKIIHFSILMLRKSKTILIRKET